MAVQNAEIAEMLNEVAEILAIKGENPFRVRAYERAAVTIERLPRSVSEMLDMGEDLSDLPGIGRDLAGKIEEIVTTRTLSLRDDLVRETPPGVLELLRIRGLGPRRVGVLHDQLGIACANDLKAAIEEHRLDGLRGFGAKTIENILKEFENPIEGERRTLLSTAEQLVQPLVAYLQGFSDIEKVTVAGSYRRRKETVGDVDILLTSRAGAKATAHFVAYEDVVRVLTKGKTKASIVLRQGLQVDLRVIPKVSYGAALLYFTGSKAHNIALRARAQDRRLKINEYGLYRGTKRLVGRTEEEMYAALKLPYIEPELREDNGEIEAAERGRLPKLISLNDIQGNLHSHTNESDGTASVEEMARAALERGHAYIGITDHSPALAMTKGLDTKRLRRQIREIDRLNQEIDGIRILKGIEVDIHKDGKLDLPDSVLSELDIVFVAIHSAFGLSREKQTQRLLKAMANPNVHVIAHPTGRIIGKRRPYDLDMDRILEAARDQNVALEINGQPDRLDLSDVYVRAAKDKGVRFVISTDAHATDHLDFLRYGIDQARRGWLEKADVLNTRDWDDILTLIRRS